MMRLNDKQTQVMNALTDRTLATIEEIRDATEIHSLTVTQVVCEQLEELGLVERAFGKWSATLDGRRITLLVRDLLDRADRPEAS